MAVTTRPPAGGSSGEAHHDPPRSGAHHRSRAARAATAYVAAILAFLIALPVASNALGAGDRIVHWGKVVHGLEAFGAAVLIGLLVFGWRDREPVQIADELAALMTMFIGALVGVVWELVEFVLDWARYSDVQKSNTDTLTDILWSNVGAVVGALVAARLYCRVLSTAERHQFGRIGIWLLDGPSRALDRLGLVLAVLAAFVAIIGVAVLWFAGRPVPGFPIS